MKNRIMTIALAALFFLASCGKEEVSEKPFSIQGNIDDPAWVVGTEYDYSSSMTAVIQVNLQMADDMPVPSDIWTTDVDDRLGAFVGDECVGVASCDDLGRFFLFIHAPLQPYGQITLRYYSNKLHNIFDTDTSFPFVNGGQQGTAAEPLQIPFWAVTQ